MSFVSRQTRIQRLLRSKTARNAFVFENIKRMVPFQIRAMREERRWSQDRAGEAIGKPQNVLSRLESPAYGKLSLQTLLDVAHGFDVGLLIKFVPFSRLVKEYEDLSGEALSAQSVSDAKEIDKLTKWAALEGKARKASPARGHVRYEVSANAFGAIQTSLCFEEPPQLVTSTAVTVSAKDEFTSDSLPISHVESSRSQKVA